MSCQRFLWREPGAFVWASSSTSNDRGFAGEGRVQIEFLQNCSTVFDGAAGQDLQAFEERFGFFSAVGLDKADNDIHAFRAFLTRGFQHGIGLSHARAPHRRIS